MVYDVPRNFIGDMHWSTGELLQEGDEMMLEKDGVMVQVAEGVGTTQTDLTELRQSAKKQHRQQAGHSSSPARSTTATPSRAMPPPTSRAASGIGSQPKHRSLNALLGTPKGPIGKAVLPAKSPYEMRQQDAENTRWNEGRPTKRRRAEPWNVVRTTMTTSSREAEKPLWARTADSKALATKRRKKVGLPTGQQKLGTTEVIDLSDDGDDDTARFLPGFSNDAIVPPSSPPKEVSVPPAARAIPTHGPIAETRRKGSAQSVDVAARLPKAAGTSRSNARSQRSSDGKDPSVHQHSASPPLAPPRRPPPSHEPAQSLHITSGAPKKRNLACLGQLARLSQESDGDQNGGRSKRKTQHDLLEERLGRARLRAKQQQDDLKVDVADVGTNDESFESRLTHLGLREEQELRQSKKVLQPPEHVEPGPLQEARRQPAQQSIEDDTTGTVGVRRMSRVDDRPSSRKPSRVLGTPVRFTPSPTRQVVLDEQRSRSNSANSEQQWPDAQTSPSRHARAPDPDLLPAIASTHSTEEPSCVAQQSEAFPARQVPPAEIEMPPPAKPARRKAGVNHKETRKSAQACFPTGLNVAAANGTSTVMLNKPFSAPKPPVQPKALPTSKEAGPWSREAFDLFAWRPPDWDENSWCVMKGVPPTNGGN